MVQLLVRLSITFSGLLCITMVKPCGCCAKRDGLLLISIIHLPTRETHNIIPSQRPLQRHTVTLVPVAMLSSYMVCFHEIPQWVVPPFQNVLRAMCMYLVSIDGAKQLGIFGCVISKVQKLRRFFQKNGYMPETRKFMFLFLYSLEEIDSMHLSDKI